MEAGCLRVGNFVLNGLPFGGYEIYEIKVYDFGTGLMKNAKPIPIKEQILTDLFKEFSHRFISKYKKEITFSTAKEGVCTFKQKIQHINLFCDFRNKIFYVKYGTKKIYVSYIHEIQNLYFTLTNEELTKK